MFNHSQRAQLRAALQLWQQSARNSRTHPAEIPACKAEFIVDAVTPLTEVEIEHLIETLQSEVTYTTLALAADRFDIPKQRLRRQLDRDGATTVPGSKVYTMSDIVVAVRAIKERDRRGPLG